MHMQEPGEDGKGERKFHIKLAQTASLGDGPRVLGESLIAGSCMGYDIYRVFLEGLSTVISC